MGPKMKEIREKHEDMWLEIAEVIYASYPEIERKGLSPDDLLDVQNEDYDILEDLLDNFKLMVCMRIIQLYKEARARPVIILP